MKNFSGGFTLLELAIGLAISGVLASSVLMPIAGRLVERERYRGTEKILIDARSAEIGFMKKNGRLPRPAKSAVDGHEEAQGCDGIVCRGFLPWAELGVSRTDAYGQIIEYAVMQNLTFAIDKNSSGSLQISTRTTNGEEIILSESSGAVIFSHGQRNWGATADNQERPDGSLSNTDEDSNSAGEKFFQRQFSDAKGLPGGEFDDIVEPLSIEVLIGELG